MAKASPSLNLMVQYVKPENVTAKEGFAGFIDYQDREETKNPLDKNQEFSGYINYMGNEEKTSNLFDAYIDAVTEKGRALYKEKFNQAQENKSVMWELVYSFDNQALQTAGLYDPETGFLNEKKIKGYTRESISKLLKLEDMTDTAIWAGAIHYNTDNIHIHVSIVEPHPVHTKKPYLKKENILAAKSVMMNRMFEMDKERQTNINKSIRDIMVKGIQNDLLEKIQEDSFYREQLEDLFEKLPADRKLWKYNNTVMAEARPIVNTIISHYITTEKKSEYDDLLAMINEQHNLFKLRYGENSSKDYVQNRIDDLYSRMGNAVLTTLRENRILLQPDQKTEKFIGRIRLPERKRTPYQPVQKQNVFVKKARYEMNAAIYNMKRAMSEEMHSYQNQLAYEELERQLDSGSQIQH